MDKYCYNGLLWFGQGEDVKIFDSDSGEELLEHTLSERKDEIELPEYTPYVYLEYIEVGDTSGPYIDTGIPMNTLNGCEVKFKYNGNNADNRALFGTYLPYYDSLIENYRGYIGWRIGNVGFSQLTATKIPLDTNVHIAKADTSAILMDSINGGVPDWSRIPSDQNVYIFNEGGNRHSPTNNARIYYVKMYKNNVLSYHLIPAKRKSDNAIGMYDIINGVFYSNSGSGSFIAGPDKYSELVPIMTSNTTPSGEAFSNSSVYHSVNPYDWEFYKPFNGLDVPTTARVSQGTIFLINEHWGYDFGPNNSVMVKKMLFGTYWYGSEANLSLKNFRVEADNGDDNWISLGSYYNDVVAGHTDYEIEINNSNYYRRYRVVALDAWNGSGYIIIAKAQFYGYKQ